MEILGMDIVPIFKFLISEEGQTTPRVDIAKKYNITVMELDRLFDMIELTKQHLANRTITITVMGGAVTDVLNLPHGWDYKLNDLDL